MRRPRLVYVVTHPVTAHLLLRGQLAFMREHGFDVTVISAPGPELDAVGRREGVATVAVPMVRVNDAPRDAVSLMRLARVLGRLAPDIVNAGTPKAGLLGMMAARAVGVPIRIYLLRGLRLETATGALRHVLAATERIASACAQDVACVSASLARVSVSGGYVPPHKAIVIGDGSSNGVDTARFARTDELRKEGAARLAALGIAPGEPVIGFVGRLVSDKGIDVLLDAFARVRAERPRAQLVLVGGDLGEEGIDPAMLARVRSAANVVATGRIADVAPFYACMDVLAFPSYREGFPNVVLEAACAEVPAVGFRVTGVVDAIVDGETGAIVAPGDAVAFAAALLAYLLSHEQRVLHGRAARERAVARYDREAVWQAWLEAYRVRLAEHGLPTPGSGGGADSLFSASDERVQGPRMR